MFKPTPRLLRPVFTGLTWLSLITVTQLLAQPTPGIYSCIDASGRTLTSDRPIAQCSDREQKVFNPSGTVKSRIGPTLTARERNQQEAKEKAELEEQARLAEEKRRDRALQVRYPTQAAHDKDRAQALAQIRVVRQASARRLEELQRQRSAIDSELEFYKKDPAKAPPSVRRQMDEVGLSMAVQEHFIADQDIEIQRVNTRFDEELARLKQLWLSSSTLLPASAASKAR